MPDSLRQCVFCSVGQPGTRSTPDPDLWLFNVLLSSITGCNTELNEADNQLTHGKLLSVGHAHFCVKVYRLTLRY